MSELSAGLVTALWLGILTSISPCPLATNIAAVSLIGRRIGSPGRVLLTGSSYTLGRILAYGLLAFLLVAGLLSAPQVSQFLQKYMNQLLGPILVLAGMVLLELIPLRLPSTNLGNRLQGKAESWGVWGAGLLGLLFALSFCPVSAALFFGSLIPLALRLESGLALPAVYGLGTGLPVMVFAVLIALGTGSVAAAYNRLVAVEKWARRITGLIFIGVGVYYCLAYIFRVFS